MPVLKSAIPLAAVGALALAPLAASAQGGPPDQPGFYLGGGIGYDRVEGEDFTGEGDDFDDSRVSYKGIAGFRFNRIWSLEGQYIDFGTAEDGPIRVDTKGWTAGVVAMVPVFEYVHPYAKIGALFWEAEGRSAVARADDDGSDLMYGVGARFGLTDRLGLRLEYERFEMNDIDVDNASANLVFDF